jgi:hypothetical protein
MTGQNPMQCRPQDAAAVRHIGAHRRRRIDAHQKRTVHGKDVDAVTDIRDLGNGR